jgi:hypothetical protein
MHQLGMQVGGTSNLDPRFAGMATKAEACREKAKECTLLAAHVADSYSRVQLRGTAALWLQMAQSVETSEEIKRQSGATAAEPGLGTMPLPRPPTDPSMTLAHVRELGAHELKVLCLNPACSHTITFGSDDYADEIKLAWFKPRMICARCGGRRIDVSPNWEEQDARQLGSRPGASNGYASHLAQKP